MAHAYRYRIPYKTKQEKEEADLFFKLEEKFRNPQLKRRLRANGQRKAHAIKDGLSARGYDQDLPGKYAEEWRLYLEVKPSVRRKELIASIKYEQKRERRYLESEYRDKLNDINSRYENRLSYYES
tara:strand:- start:1489 stop:1866 length:378 start_codon:yes stop_codon:yes gene_type:complete